MAKGITQSLILCGHSHPPRVVRLSGWLFDRQFGSAGCPGYYDLDAQRAACGGTGTPDPCYAILDDKSAAGR